MNYASIPPAPGNSLGGLGEPRRDRRFDSPAPCVYQAIQVVRAIRGCEMLGFMTRYPFRADARVDWDDTAPTLRELAQAAAHRQLI